MGMSVTQELKQTFLTENHRKRGAKLTAFGGWDMPLQYTKVLEEHRMVREHCGLFDIGHMGVITLSHDQFNLLRDALDGLVGQDLSLLYPGKAMYTQLLNEEAGIIDDIIVYQGCDAFSEAGFSGFNQLLVICNAGNTATVLAWLKTHLPSETVIRLQNDQYALLALQGPQFKAALAKSELKGELPRRFHISKALLLDGIPVLLSRTGYTGEDGVELLIPVAQIEAVWEALLKTAAPIGLAARDTLRLEAGYPLHGADIGPETTPDEAGLNWSVKRNKAIAFMGQAVLQKQECRKQLVCLAIQGRSIPRHGDVIYDSTQKSIGEITSGGFSPTLNIPIAMGYIGALHPLALGSSLTVDIRGTFIDAKVVDRPFVKR
jgi:aminomethyltransferase